MSSRSCFGDDTWEFDIDVAGRRGRTNRVLWQIPLPEGASISAVAYAALLRSVRHWLWSMTTRPPSGRKAPSASTLLGHAVLAKVIVRWMAIEGIPSFRLLMPSAVDTLAAWLRARPGRRLGTELSPTALSRYLDVLHAMFLQRALLDDAPACNPLPGETAGTAAGVSRRTAGRIPHIPDPVAVHLLSKALEWVEVYADAVLAGVAARERSAAAARAAGATDDQAKDHMRRVLKEADILGPANRLLRRIRDVERCEMHLVSACFAVIAGFVGMRASEILSLRVGAVEWHPLGATGQAQAYLAARLFKGSERPGGRPERWLAPAPAVAAVACLERLRAAYGERCGNGELFMVRKGWRSEPSLSSTGNFAWRLREFAKDVDMPLHDGRVWHLSPHQFRKTFARFVARGDRSGLLALANHFKHASLAMTSRHYVGTDHELNELVDAEGRAETALALEAILRAPALGGRMGDRITARNHAFRGRAGDQVRRGYIERVLADTDLRVRGCDYGWCVFQAEVALCGGDSVPDEAARSPAVCSGCANFVADARHVPYWRDRRRRNAELLSRASLLTRAALEEAIAQCDFVLAPFSGEIANGGR